MRSAKSISKIQITGMPTVLRHAGAAAGCGFRESLVVWERNGATAVATRLACRAATSLRKTLKHAAPLWKRDSKLLLGQQPVHPDDECAVDASQERERHVHRRSRGHPRSPRLMKARIVGKRRVQQSFRSDMPRRAIRQWHEQLLPHSSRNCVRLRPGGMFPCSLMLRPETNEDGRTGNMLLLPRPVRGG